MEKGKKSVSCQAIELARVGGLPGVDNVHCRVWATVASRCGRGMVAGGGGAILEVGWGLNNQSMGLSVC